MIGLTLFGTRKPAGEKGHKIEKLTPAQRNEKHLQKLTSELNLNEKQQKEVGESFSRTVCKKRGKTRRKKKIKQSKTKKREKLKCKRMTLKIKSYSELLSKLKNGRIKSQKKEEFKEKRQETRKRAEK